MKVRDKAKGEDSKSRRQRELDDLRAQWGNDDDDEDKEDGNRFKPSIGRNTIRVLPPADPKDRWFESFAMHYVKLDGREHSVTHRCIEPGGPFGHNKKLDKKRNYRASKCPSCKKFCKQKTKGLRFKFGSEEGKAFWADHVVKWRAKHQYIFGIARPKSKADASKAFWMQVGIMIGKPLIDAYYDDDGGVDFTNVDTGNNIRIISKKKGDYAEYTTRILPAQCQLRNWKKIKKQLPNLKSFVPEELEPDAIKALFEAEDDDDDDDVMPDNRKGKRHDDADDDEDDDEENPRKHRLSKRKRDKDEEVDPDADEIDDPDLDDVKPKLSKAERRRKKKLKRSKMRERLARKAQRGDD